MSNNTLFGSASATIIKGFNTMETVMDAIHTSAKAANNVADVALATSETYKKSAILKQKKELLIQEKELEELAAPKKEKGKKKGK